MKRLAIGIALGLVAAPFTGCDKGEDKKEEASGEKGKDGEKGGDKGGDKGGEKAAGATVADAMKYIPDGANLIIGLDAAKVAGSDMMKDNKDMLQQGDAGEMMAAADACKVGMSTWKYALVGGNTDKDKEVVAVVSATGVGKKDTLDCIGKKVKEKNPDEKFEVGEEDGRVVVTGGEDGQKIFAVSDDVIALVGADSQEAFKGLLGGSGKAAVDGSLKDVLGAIDQSKHIYFGMIATADMQEGPMAGLKHVTGTVDLSNGLALAAAGDFGDEAKAKELTEMANKQFTEMKGMAGMLGIPQPVVDSVKIEAKGGAVTASAKASKDDLKKLAETAKKQMGGPGGAPGGAEAPN